MRPYLLLGPPSPINRAIVGNLNAVEDVHLTWLVVEDSKYMLTSDDSFADVDFVLVKREEGLKETLKSLDADLSFMGIVYAEGIGGVRPVKMVSDSFLQEMFHANVFRFFDLIRSLIKLRKIADGASIVTLSSVSSIKGLKSKAVYSASKAALDAAVRGMAVELAAKKIRVNSIQKGWVDVDMELDFIKDNMSLSGGSDFNEQPLGAIPVGELGRLIRFLLSDELTTMTGENLVLDGGYTL